MYSKIRPYYYYYYYYSLKHTCRVSLFHTGLSSLSPSYTHIHTHTHTHTHTRACARSTEAACAFGALSLSLSPLDTHTHTEVLRKDGKHRRVVGWGQGQRSLRGQAVASRGWPAELHPNIGNREVGKVMVVGGGEGVGVCVALGVKLYWREGGECEYACKQTH